MDPVKIFITTCIEYFALITLIRTLENKQHNEYLKILISSVIASLAVVFTDLLNIPASFILDFSLIIFLIILFFKTEIFNTFIEFITMCTLFIIIEMILIFIINLFIPVLQVGDTFLKDLIGSISTLILTLFLKRKIPFKKHFIRYKNELCKMYFLLFNLTFCIMITKLIWEFDSRFLVKYCIAIILIICIFITINCVFMVYNKKLKDQAKELETYSKYSPIVTNIIEDTKRKQHDFKNHLNTIYGLVQTSKEYELKADLEKYLISLNSSLKDLDRIITIDNKIISAIIYCKICAAAEQKISFIYDIKYANKVPINDYEVSEVLNNLIDNAFEAVAQISIENRDVYLKIEIENENYIIETKNKGFALNVENLKIIFNKGFTTKLGPDHGYGLFNVKKIVESYYGEIQLCIDNDYLITRLSIPIEVK